MSADEFEEDLDELDKTHGPEERMAALEQKIREADSAGLVTVAYYHRMDFIREATHHGYQHQALVAFSWCLAQFDKTPDEFDIDGILWDYKWIVANIHAYPQVARSKIESLLDDMQRRYQEAGYSQRSVHNLRLSNAIHTGDFDTADEAFSLWKKSKIDYMADCRACEEDRVVEYFAGKEDDEAAINHAAKLFAGEVKSGWRCDDVPRITIAHVVRPYLRLGRPEKVREIHEAWYPKLEDNRGFLDAISELLLFWVSQKNFEIALELFEKHAAWSDTPNQDRRLLFLLASWQLFDKLTDKQSEVTVLVPKSMSVHNSSGTYSTKALSDWFLKESQELAAQFDERNQNRFCSGWLDKTEQIASGN